jgi:hypothetical protein
MTVEGGQDWLVSLPNQYENFVYEATATPRWLQPRMPVRFEADVPIEKRKREIELKEPVKSLTVTPFRPDVGVGVFPEQTNPLQNDLFAGRGEAARKKQQGVQQPETLPCLIVGQLMDSKQGKLRMAAGPLVVRFELAEDATIAVQWHDPQWVRPGDRAEITARHPAGRIGQAEGQQITVTAAQVLDVEEKVARGRRLQKRSGDSPQPESRDDQSEKPQQESKRPDNG